MFPRSLAWGTLLIYLRDDIRVAPPQKAKNGQSDGGTDDKIDLDTFP